MASSLTELVQTGSAEPGREESSRERAERWASWWDALKTSVASGYVQARTRRLKDKLRIHVRENDTGHQGPEAAWSTTAASDKTVNEDGDRALELSEELALECLAFRDRIARLKAEWQESAAFRRRRHAI
ncbi:hypothetical protein PybrP1_000346 [[Pythium] brassicae (nom. inval.)]|nr:hypothetical protein PybrP1_000346 [[Pythium] brassicae (nom. inval.)]